MNYLELIVQVLSLIMWLLIMSIFPLPTVDGADAPDDISLKCSSDGDLSPYGRKTEIINLFLLDNTQRCVLLSDMSFFLLIFADAHVKVLMTLVQLKEFKFFDRMLHMKMKNEVQLIGNNQYMYIIKNSSEFFGEDFHQNTFIMFVEVHSYRNTSPTLTDVSTYSKVTLNKQLMGRVIKEYFKMLDIFAYSPDLLEEDRQKFLRFL